MRILAEAAQIGAGTTVIGSHGHGALYNLLMGSVAESIVKHATCPVLIVPAKTAPTTEAETQMQADRKAPV